MNYEGEARDYVMKADWDHRSDYGTPSQASPGSDCSESESSPAIRSMCTQEANPGLGQRPDPWIVAEVPRREARSLKRVE